MRQAVRQHVPTPALQPVLAGLRTYYRRGPKTGQQAIWNRVASHLWWAEQQTRARTRFGAKMTVDARDIVGRYIAYFGIWEPNLTAWLARQLKPGDTFVDVGANIGYFTLLASKFVGDRGHVIAIEPNPGTLQLLRQNVADNQAGNVRVVAAGASDQACELPLYADGVKGIATFDSDWANGHDLRPVGTMPVRPLPELVGDLTPTVIKVDVEGHELPVLRSALPLLESHPAIAVETLAESVDAAVDIMRPLGYQVSEIVNDYTAAAYIRGDEREPVAFRGPDGRDQIDLIFSQA